MTVAGSRSLLVFLAASLFLAIPHDSVSGPTDNGPARMVVLFKKDTKGLPEQAAAIRCAGGAAVKPLPMMNAFAARLTPGAKAGLAGNPHVEGVYDDIVLTATPRNPDAWTGRPPWSGGPAKHDDTLPWGVDRIDAEWVWGGAEDATKVVKTPEACGEYVKVGVLDTGIDLDHRDLAANIGGQVNFIDPAKSADDDNGHGTFVAGIIAGVDDKSGVIGVAPRVRLYALKILDASGNGWLTDLMEAVHWCIMNDVRLVNMSFAAPDDNTVFQALVIQAHMNGITMVAAAGNGGGGGVLYPARYPETIAVAAVDEGDAAAAYTSFGPEVDLVAPGTGIFSAWAGGTYRTANGTSAAAPHVTGAAALVMQKYDSLSPDELKARLKDTAEDVGLDQTLYGAGLVDAQWAVAAAP